jgi:zinc protease
MTDRSIPPLHKPDSSFSFLRPEEIRLGNGLPVYLLEGGTEEVVKVDLVFHAGSFFQLKPLLAYSTANLIKAGSGSMSAKEIDETLDNYGAMFRVNAQKDIVSLSLLALQKHLEPVLGILHDIMLSPAFEEEEMQVMLKNQKQQFLIDSRKVQHLARTYFNELVFGNEHPYGYRLVADDFDRVERRDILDFHKTFFHPGNGFCIVSGRPPAHIRTLLEQHLGDANWQARQPGAPPAYIASSASEKKVLVQKNDALQSAIRIGRRIINRTHRDYHRLMITNALLGGYFGSRLMQNIRQDKGYTYGINSGLVSLLRDGYFFIATQVGIDVCQQALDQVYVELKNLRTRPATEQELQTLKNYLYGDFLRSFDGPFAQSEQYKEMLVFRMDISYHEGFLKELKHISPEQIMQTAAQYLHEDSMIELVVGGKQGR